MDNTEISTSVDVKLSHADMVELIIEEQKELAEAQYADLAAELEGVRKKADALKDKIENAVIKSCAINSTKEVKAFKAICKAMDTDPKDHLQITVVQKKDNKNTLTELVTWDPDKYEEYKNPMTVFKKDFAKYARTGSTISIHYSKGPIVTRFYPCQIEEVTITFGYIYSHESFLRLSCSRTIHIKEFKFSAALKADMKQLDELNLQIAKLTEDLNKVDVHLFMLDNDGVRNKAKFVKGLLNNSASGKNLLGLMGKIQKSNLLEIGTKK